MLLKSTGTGTSLSISNLSTLFFKLLKLLDTFFNLSIFTLSTSDFKLVKSVFQAKSDVQQLLGFLNLLLLHKSYCTFTISHEDFSPGKYSLIYVMSFLSIQI